MKRTPVQTTSQAHPWHGISPGEDVPNVVTAYIEIVPTDAVKYELDKPSGLLRVDRPQRFSSRCPTLYGFIPQSYCDELVARRAADRTGIKDMEGDHDPLDICVLTEKPIISGNLLVRAVPVGACASSTATRRTTRSSPCSRVTSSTGSWSTLPSCRARWWTGSSTTS